MTTDQHVPGNNVEAAQDRLTFVFSHKIFSVSVKQPRSQGLSYLPQLVVGTETLGTRLSVKWHLAAIDLLLESDSMSCGANSKNPEDI